MISSSSLLVLLAVTLSLYVASLYSIYKDRISWGFVWTISGVIVPLLWVVIEELV